MLRRSIFFLALLLLLPLEGWGEGGVLKLRFQYPKGDAAEGVVWIEDTPSMQLLLDSLALERFRVDSLRIEGWASPESSLKFNRALSHRRAENVRERITRHLVSLPEQVRVLGSGENWEPVKEYLKNTTDRTVLAWRDTMLHIIAVNPDVDRREWIVRQLDGGRPWSLVQEACYDHCRFVEVTVWYDEQVRLAPEPEPEPEPVVAPEPEPAVQPAPADTVMPVPYVAPVPVEAPLAKDWRWAIRTNLLIPAMNVGVGYTAGPKGRLTLGADWFYPWIWPAKSNRWCFEILALGLEARWTFRDGTDPLVRGTGPSVGVGVMAGYFDYEREYKGIQGEYIAPCIDFRWTFPINKKRWRLGVGVGAGYLHARTRDYVVYYEGGDLYRTGEYTNYINYFGPMRADVTLSIPIWHKSRVKEGRDAR